MGAISLAEFDIDFQYCPNVDRFIACILLDLIELTRIHVGDRFQFAEMVLSFTPWL